MGDVSSARPARLTRFGDTASAMDDGLRRRFGHLSDALETYRATCEYQYRMSPTGSTPQVLRAWSGGIDDLGRWVQAVGEAFIRTQAVDVYVKGYGETDVEGVMTLTDARLIAALDEEYQDDPFLGVPAGGWKMNDRDVSAEDPDALADLLDDLGLAAGVADSFLGNFNDLLAKTPRTATVKVVITETDLIFTSEGRVIARITRAEATARFLVPGSVPSGLATTARWVKGVGNTLAFAGAAYGQWQKDAEMSTGKRVLRASTEGLGVLGGGVVGGWAGGAAGGAAAGLVCGPGAPVCSTLMAIGGGILGGIGGGAIGGWFVDVLPWMHDPPEPLPGEYDLDALTDELAQKDGALSKEFGPVDDATTLTAADLARVETADSPDIGSELELILPDPGELSRGPQPSAPPTGTTTTTVPPVPSPSPGPAPTPSPSPGPSPTPTGTTVPSR